MPLISSCFWTYPTTSIVPAGRVLRFEVIVPPPSTVGVGFPLTGSTVSWSLLDTSSPSNPLVPGVDFFVVEGDLISDKLVVVFKPPASDKTVQIVPTLSLFSAAVAQPEISEFTPKTFTLQPMDADASAMPFISSCFWTYPTTSTVPVGQVLEFEVIVPLPSTVVGATFPLTGSTVSWSLLDTASPPNPLVPGVDFFVVEGDLTSAKLVVVFKPPASDKRIKIVPRLSLFSAAAAQPEISEFTPETFTLQPIDASAISLVQSQIANAISLTTENSIIEPGVPAVLEIAPKNPLDIPQVVTSILHETPKVRIRGAIPLDNIIQAFLARVTSAVGQFIPGSRSIVSDGAKQMRRLLGGLFTVPVAIDVLGDKVTKTLAPLGAPQIPLLSASPDGQVISGVVPVGSWPLSFSTTNVTWEVMVNNVSTVYNDLSPGVNLVKSFLLYPPIVPISTNSEAMAPIPITVTATVQISLDTGTSLPSDITIKLPSLTLQRLPLPLPQIAAVFTQAFDDVDKAADQRVYLTCDRNTAPFISSVDDCLNLIISLSTALNRIVAVATTLGTDDWSHFLNLAGAFSVLADKVSRISVNSTPGAIYFQPCLCLNPGPCISLNDTSWDQSISAVIAIGPPLQKDGFVLSDENVLVLGYIQFGTTKNYSTIIPNLKGKFNQILQIPPGSAFSNQPDTDFNDILESLGYGRVG